MRSSVSCSDLQALISTSYFQTLSLGLKVDEICMQEGEAKSPFLQTLPLGVYCLVEVGIVEEIVPPHPNLEGCLAQFLAAVFGMWGEIALVLIYRS